MLVIGMAHKIPQGLPVPQLPGNSGPVYGGGPSSYEHAPDNAVATTPSSFQGGGNTSTSYIQPTQVNVLPV